MFLRSLTPRIVRAPAPANKVVAAAVPRAHDEAMSDLIVETSEGLRLRHPLAGAGSRSAAAAFDFAVVGVAFAIVVLAGYLLSEALGFGAIVPWLLLGGAPLVLIGLRVAQQAAWNGQTLGKRLLGLRVVSGDGYPASVFQLVMRELLILVDILTVPIYLGVLLIQLGAKRQRLGDLAANTVVLRVPPEASKFQPFAGQTWAQLEPKTLPLTPGFAARFGPEDLDILRELWTRRNMRLEERRSLFVTAARHYAQRLGVDSYDDARTLLKELYLFLRDARTEASSARRTEPRAEPHAG